jgi:Fe(3+) dicitrate transport protein
LIFDISFKYNLRSDITLKSKILNLFDNDYAVSRAPAGLRPGHPLGIYAGFEYKF